jgi:diguanylate cyclase (GGDEF)-like protein
MTIGSVTGHTGERTIQVRPPAAGLDDGPPGESSMPRLTRSAFHDLAIWMTGLGLLTGLAFPPFSLLLGLPAADVLTLPFALACVAAGLLVGGINYAIARVVVGTRLRLLAGRMETVRVALADATFSGDWSACDPQACSLPVDSTDDFGTSAATFNALILALGTSHQVEDGIRRFSTTLSAHLDLDDLARAALRQLVEMSGADGAAILVEHDGALAVAGSLGLENADRLPESRRVREALAAGATARIDLADEVTIDAAVASFPVRSVLVVPLAVKGVSVGALVLAAGRPIDAERARLVEFTRPLLSVAVANAVTHERIQRLATLDPLTGLYNRRFGMARLHEEFARSIRSGQPFGVAIFDIDHFKAVNDTYGHATGDRVLVAVAGAARRVLREGDVLVRYGGEEFLAILVGASSDDAERIGERIRRVVGESVVEDGSQAVRVTVSVGLASSSDREISDEAALIKIADGAMYAAKQGGRNQISVG